MATIKKNQLANIVFPIVDGTDFASVESGLTASNFESKVTKKYFGVTHGNSTAFTSGTISKAATLVRSGIFQQTLKAAETNFDYVLYSFIPNNTSLAHQMLVFQPVDYDDSDIFSQLSDIGSNLLSYLTGMSGMMSDVQSALDSQFLILTSNISDIDSQLLLNASVISDIQSALDSQFVWTSNFLSDMNSDLSSQIGGITASVTASDMSDIASRVWATAEGTRVDSRILVIQSLVSDVDSQVLLNASVLSDIQSALDSQFTWTSNFLSDMNSDLSSQIGGITASVTASDMSDIASRVWATAEGTRVDSRILVIQSLVSDVDSQLLLNASMISDVQSALDSQFTWTSAFLSDMNSDLSSQIGGITASVTASDMSDIASRVWATAEGTRVDSRILVLQSLVSDVDSQLLLNASMISDIQSALDSQFLVVVSNLSDVESQVDLLATSNYLSQVHSDLTSQIGGITASVSASDISDIASAVWAAKYTTHSLASSFGSLVSDVYSRLALTQSNVSDVQSALDSQFTYLSNAISDMHSDLGSQIGGITASITASDMSDIASRVWATAEGTRVDSRILVIQSLVSDVDSQLLLNASMISDIQSALDSQFVWTSNFLSDMNSDLSSQIGGITASVSASDISDIASAVWAAKYTTHSAASSFGSLVSDVYSRLALTQSNVSDVQSALDSQFVYLSNAISDMHSDLGSQIGGITASITASDMSDIASRVWATTEGTRVDSRILVIQSLVSDVDSQLLLNASMISDIQSALDSQFVWTSNFLSDMNSDLSSQIGGITASISASDISDITSAVWGYPLTSRTVTLSASDMSDIRSAISAGPAATVTASDISDIASAVWANTIGARVDSRIVLVQSNVSDIESQLDVTASVVSDIQSALDSQFTWTSNFLSDMNSDLSSQIGGITASIGASDISDIASAVWADTIGARVDSRLRLVQSNISDVESQLDVTHSSVSDIYSLLSDVDSQLTVTHSLVSDIDSQLLLNASVISDVQSAVAALNDISVADVLTTQMTEAYAADGTAPTLAQALFLIQQSIGDFSITGTTLTVKKLDGTTTAATYTLDDATDPTSRTRAT